MALIDHVVVLSHLQPQVIAGPPVQSYEETLRALRVPEEAILALPEAHRRQLVGVEGKAEVSVSALAISERGLVREVDWPCGCGAPLHRHHEFVVSAWAKHVAEIEKIDADHLLKHVIHAIAGSKPRVECACGEQFQAEGHFPNEALTAWEAHVRSV
jgi:hypothetical protein